MAKYIKREWKKGKWVYTYKEPPKKKREFKYIKREWKKDHWEYTYPEDLKDKIKEGFSDLVDKAKDALGFDEKAELNEKKSNFDIANEILNTTKKVGDKASISDAISDFQRAGKDYITAKSDFMKTPIGKVSQLKSAIAIGVNIVKKCFLKLIE